MSASALLVCLRPFSLSDQSATNSVKIMNIFFREFTLKTKNRKTNSLHGK